MLGFTLWPNLGGFTSYDDGLRLDRAAHVPLPLPSDVPLATHAWYRREGLLAALDWASLQRSARGNITGVAWSEATQTDALMVNLRKRVHNKRRGTSVLLFVRETPTDELGAAAFLLLGLVRYVGHRGERPIAIT